MTALPRGRSKEVGMGMVSLHRKTSQEKPRLGRMNSSSSMLAGPLPGSGSGSGSGSLDRQSGKLGRPGSTGSDLLIDRNVKMTITDLFLSDMPELTASDEDTIYAKPFVPLPAAIQTTIEKLQKQDSKHSELAKQQKQRALSESKLQEYWKSNAQWPSWPVLKENRERQKPFRDSFQDGLSSATLIRHCGEQLKCSAYVVVCSTKLGIRSKPTADSDKQTGNVLFPGQMVVVDNILRFDGIDYLKLRDGGWVFQRKDNMQCMSYMTAVEIGPWWYRVVSAEYAEVRCSPSFRESARTGHMLVPGEVIVVGFRCYVDGYRWMVLADGRGWMFEMRPPIYGFLENSAEERVIAECDEDKSATDVDQTLNMNTGGVVEIGMWEYEVMNEVLAIGSSTSGWLLPKAERIFVDMRVPANGLKVKEASSRTSITVETRIWLRLHDGRGWVPKTYVDGLPNVRFVKVPIPGAQHTPKHANPTKAQDVDWLSGVA